MRRVRVPILALLAIFSLQPALAATHRHGLGAALVTGVVDCEDSCDDQFEFIGFALFGKIGLTDNWGLLITYRDMEDDEDFLLNREDTYTQLAVQAIHMWRPTKDVRPHVMFGLESTDFETKIPAVLTQTDNNTGLAFGGGFEAGFQTAAFFLNYDFTFVELFDENFMLGNLDLGIIFKF